MHQATVDLTEHRVTGKYQHYVGVVTPGFMELPTTIQAAIINAFLAAPQGDHFYSVTCDGAKVFIAENGERGYTAMLPSEY